MAKRSMIEREKRRARTVKKYAAKRAEPKAILADTSASDEEKWEAQVALQKLPRDSSPVRSEEHTSELQSRGHLVCRLLLEKKKHYHKLLHLDDFFIFLH